jgi:hypothetical protein
MTWPIKFIVWEVTALKKPYGSLSLLIMPCLVGICVFHSYSTFHDIGPQDVVQLVGTTSNEVEVITLNLSPPSCGHVQKKKK